MGPSRTLQAGSSVLSFGEGNCWIRVSNIRGKIVRWIQCVICPLRGWVMLASAAAANEDKNRAAPIVVSNFSFPLSLSSVGMKVWKTRLGELPYIWRPNTEGDNGSRNTPYLRTSRLGFGDKEGEWVKKLSQFYGPHIWKLSFNPTD